MPELPEIFRYARDVNYNTGGAGGLVFTRVDSTDPVKKPAPSIPYERFWLRAKSRGKQLVLEVYVDDNNIVPLKFSFGLVGGLVFRGPKEPDPEGVVYTFSAVDGSRVVYYDVMKMGRCTPGDFEPLSQRGPCPYTETEAFVANLDRLSRAKLADKPICEVLLDQKYFNGIGNYLRAEIMHRANVDPFVSARTVMSDSQRWSALVGLCTSLPDYIVSNGLNKYGTEAEKAAFREWQAVYDRGVFRKDSKNRKVFYAESQIGCMDTPVNSNSNSNNNNNNFTTTPTTLLPPHFPHNTWANALASEFCKPYFDELLAFVEGERATQQVFPPPEDVFSAFAYTPLEEVKVVILGQDPYHDDNQAHGLCFSINDPTIKVPPSLVNIYKELESEGLMTQRPTHGNLTDWARRGVFLLNAVLTVQAHKANSHARKGWEKFTKAVVDTLNSEHEGLVFMLWGASAQKMGKSIDRNRHCVLETVHPSPLSASRGWFGCGHFTSANEYLQSNGKQPIDWNLHPSGPTLTAPPPQQQQQQQQQQQRAQTRVPLGSVSGNTKVLASGTGFGAKGKASVGRPPLPSTLKRTTSKQTNENNDDAAALIAVFDQLALCSEDGYTPTYTFAKHTASLNEPMTLGSSGKKLSLTAGTEGKARPFIDTTPKAEDNNKRSSVTFGTTPTSAGSSGSGGFGGVSKTPTYAEYDVRSWGAAGGAETAKTTTAVVPATSSWSSRRLSGSSTTTAMFGARGFGPSKPATATASGSADAGGAKTTGSAYASRGFGGTSTLSVSTAGTTGASSTGSKRNSFGSYSSTSSTATTPIDTGSTATVGGRRLSSTPAYTSVTEKFAKSPSFTSAFAPSTGGGGGGVGTNSSGVGGGARASVSGGFTSNYGLGSGDSDFAAAYKSKFASSYTKRKLEEASETYSYGSSSSRFGATTPPSVAVGFASTNRSAGFSKAKTSKAVVAERGKIRGSYGSYGSR